MNKENRMDTSVVFPMFNEKDNIRKSIEGCENVLKNEAGDYEIIVVDDASTDGSGRIADELAAKLPYVRVAHHQANRKLGGTLRTGFNLAAKELILYSDIDMPFDFREIRKALRIMHQENADLVSAYRTNREAEGIRRYVYSVLYNWFIRLTFGLVIRDVNFSFKLIKKSLLDKLVLCSEGSFIDAELLIQAKQKRAKIVQFGTEYFPRKKGISRLSGPRVILKILKEALIFRFSQFLCGEDKKR